MATLLLRLAAPLQAWGSDSKFNIRSTEREPTKSGVIGMVAAALGIQRNEDPAKLKPLSELKFGVRVERDGVLLRDFHMVHEQKASHVTERYYLSDAVFLAALNCDDRGFLEKIAAALENPVYPLFLGRRSCPPTLPLVIGITEDDLVDSLRNADPLTGENNGSKRIVYEASEGRMVWEVPMSFSQLHRQYGLMYKKEEMLPAQEHDPMAEL